LNLLGFSPEIVLPKPSALAARRCGEINRPALGAVGRAGAAHAVAGMSAAHRIHLSIGIFQMGLFCQGLTDRKRADDSRAQHRDDIP
jgi:hypothetical protein